MLLLYSNDTWRDVWTQNLEKNEDHSVGLFQLIFGLLTLEKHTTLPTVCNGAFLEAIMCSSHFTLLIIIWYEWRWWCRWYSGSADRKVASLSPAPPDLIKVTLSSILNPK